MVHFYRNVFNCSELRGFPETRQNTNDISRPYSKNSPISSGSARQASNGKEVASAERARGKTMLDCSHGSER